MRTSKRLSARAINSPLLTPAQPILGTEATSWPVRSRSNRQSKFSSRRILKSGRFEHALLRHFQESDHLIALNARKALKKIIYSVSTFEVSEKATDWYPSASKHRR